MADTEGVKVEVVSAEGTTRILASFTPRHRQEVDWEVQRAYYLKSDAHSRNIFTRSWVPKEASKPKAVVFLMHGVNEHISRYVDIAHHLTRQGFAVFGHDHVGHGASAGVMGDLEDFSFAVKDAKQVILSQSAKFPGAPVFILGHSMGSLVAFHTALELEKESPGLIRGVVFSGFASVPGPSSASPFGLRCLFCLTQNEAASARIGGFMARMAPRGNLAPVIMSELTHDKDELAFIATDPYHNRGQIQNRTGNEVLKATKRYRALVSDFRLPFIALHGAADTLTFPEGSQHLFDHAGSSDKSLKFYPGLFHEILLETGRDAVYKDVTDFFLARLEAKTSPSQPPATN